MFKLLATPLAITFVQWQNLILITFKLCAKYFVYANIDDAYKYTNDVFTNVTLCTRSSLIMSLFYASDVFKYCTVHNIQAQRLNLPSVDMYQHITTFQLTHKMRRGKSLINKNLSTLLGQKKINKKN